MNRSLRLSISSVLAPIMVILAGAFGATPAFAAASLTSIISTPEDELYSAYATKTSPDGNIQAIPAYDTDRVVFVYADTLTYVTVEDQFADIAAPRAVAFAPDGNTLYVANYDSTSIAIIDVATANVIGSFNGGDDEATAIGVSPDGTKIVVVADGNNINVFDVTDSFNQIASTNAVSGNEFLQVYFTSNEQAWVVSLTADASLVNLSDGSIDRSFDNAEAGGYGVCANADLSRLIWVSNDNHATVVDMADGSTVAILNLVGVTDNAEFCTVTNQNKLLISDYVDDPSQLLVVDLETLVIEQALALPGLAFANGINVMNGCVALVEGYYENIAVVQLDDNICEKPAPVLANTGAERSIMGWMFGGGVALLAAGLLLMTRRRV